MFQTGHVTAKVTWRTWVYMPS